MRLQLFPLVHFYMWGLTAQAASAHHIHIELWCFAIFAWCAYLTIFLALA